MPLACGEAPGNYPAEAWTADEAFDLVTAARDDAPNAVPLPGLL
jgi:hypothetical protein